MRRIAIIDRSEHNLIIDDIDETLLEDRYNGDAQAYIDDNYTFSGSYVWDYIIDVDYLPVNENLPIEIDFDDIVEIYG